MGKVSNFLGLFSAASQTKFLQRPAQAVTVRAKKFVLFATIEVTILSNVLINGVDIIRQR